MPIEISKHTLHEIRTHAEDTYPEECCGLLIADKNKRIIGSMRTRNAYIGPKHSRYSIAPVELLKADRLVSQKGLIIAGVYHSHPDNTALLSKFDLRFTFSWYVYIVVSVLEGKARDTRSWMPRKDHRSALEEKIIEIE